MREFGKVCACLLLALIIILESNAAAFAANFTDVSTGIWYAEGVQYVSENGLMSGTGNGKFSPNTPMSRAMLAAVLHRMDGTPAPASTASFSDVPQGAYYERAVAWAAENKIVSGIGGGKFGSENHITRQDLAVMLYRYGNFKGYDISSIGNLAAFSDRNRIAGYAQQAMQWAVGSGILQGDSGRLMPTGNATRAQVAIMLMRFMQNIASDQPGSPDTPTPAPVPTPSPVPSPTPEESRLLITVNGQRFYGELYDNESATALEAMLPLTLNIRSLTAMRNITFLTAACPQTHHAQQEFILVT